MDKKCYICSKKGHFVPQCKPAKVHHIDDEYSNEELFFIHAVNSLSDKPALATCTVNERHKVTFEIDTGASCNILPFAEYVKATGDKRGTQMSPSKTWLTMHNNSSAIPLGKVMLHVEQGAIHIYYNSSRCSHHAVMPILEKTLPLG